MSVFRDLFLLVIFFEVCWVWWARWRQGIDKD